MAATWGPCAWSWACPPVHGDVFTFSKFAIAKAVFLPLLSRISFSNVDTYSIGPCPCYRFWFESQVCFWFESQVCGCDLNG